MSESIQRCEAGCPVCDYEQRAHHARTVDLMFANTAGKHLGVTAARVHQMANSGLLPEVRTIDGHRLYLVEDVAALASSRRRHGQYGAPWRNPAPQ